MRGKQVKKITSVLFILGLALILGGCTSPAGTTTPTTTTGATTTPPVTPTATINLTAQNLAFSTAEISAPAGKMILIVFNNRDAGVNHNFALYTNSQASTVIFRGQIIRGVDTIEYRFDTPATPGTYFFRCDVHPDMTGNFIVTAS